MPTSNKPKVVLVISGGVLQDAYATDPNIDVALIDHDDLAAAPGHATGHDIEAVATAGLHCLEVRQIDADDTHPRAYVVATLNPRPTVFSYVKRRADGEKKLAEANRLGCGTFSVMTEAEYAAAERAHHPSRPSEKSPGYTAKERRQPSNLGAGR